MSNANSPIKVLKAAHKRVSKQWTKNTWRRLESDGNYSVCLEGAIYGFCRNPNPTVAQKKAIEVVEQIIAERYASDMDWDPKMTKGIIPPFNDNPETTQEDVLEVIKFGIIRLETEEMEKEFVDEVEAMGL